MEYINGIPGLDAHRLGELYPAVVAATEDKSAICNLTYRGAGGLRIRVAWTQNGGKHEHIAELDADEVRRGMAWENPDEFFTTFVSAELDIVRQRVAAVDGVHVIDGAVSFSQRVREARDSMLAFVGKLRSSK